MHIPELVLLNLINVCFLFFFFAYLGTDDDDRPLDDRQG